MSAKRQRGREGWPDRLYETNGYFYWRHPVTKKNYGLGRDLDKAKAQAVEANLHVVEMHQKSRLVDRLTGNDNQTVGALLSRYTKDMMKRELALNTLKTKQTLINRVESKWGRLPYDNLSTTMIDDFLQEYVDAGKDRMAQTFQSFLVELCNKAIAIGWAKHNPASVTEKIYPKVKRDRLSLDEFLRIYKAAENLDPYVRHAMELALVTAQRREDIALWDRSIIRDGLLWVEQGKSENTEHRGAGHQTRLAIPLDLRMIVTSEAGVLVDFCLKEVIASCWADRVASKYFIHQTINRGNAPSGSPVWKDTLTKAFAKARDLAGIEGQAGKNPPTFHELRSLSINLWKELRGKDFAQALAGHKQASTTDIYTDPRGNWMILKSA